MASGHSHSHEVGASHSHVAAADHGHTHEILDGPGSFLGREMPIIEGRDWKERAFTVGIGGCVVVSLFIQCFCCLGAHICIETDHQSSQTRRIWKDSSDAGVMPRASRQIQHCCSHQ